MTRLTNRPSTPRALGFPLTIIVALLLLVALAPVLVILAAQAPADTAATAPESPRWLEAMAPVLAVLIPILASHLYEIIKKGLYRIRVKLSTRMQQFAVSMLTAAIAATVVALGAELPAGVDPLSFEAFMILLAQMFAAMGWHGVAISPRPSDTGSAKPIVTTP